MGDAPVKTEVHQLKAQVFPLGFQAQEIGGQVVQFGIRDDGPIGA